MYMSHIYRYDGVSFVNDGSEWTNNQAVGWILPQLLENFDPEGSVPVFVQHPVFGYIPAFIICSVVKNIHWERAIK
jgi:hypothetical protein